MIVRYSRTCAVSASAFSECDARMFGTELSAVVLELLETSQWLAEQAGAELVEFPGAHAGYFEHPWEWAGRSGRSCAA